MKKILFALLILFGLFFSQRSSAQHQHDMGNMPMKTDTVKKKSVQKPKKKTTTIKKVAAKTNVQHNMNDTMKHDMEIDHMTMSSSFSKNLPMNRNGSGTSWLPDASPVYGHMIMNEKSMFMLHGNIFLRYTNQDIFNKGSRGGSGFNAPNWFMGMYQKEAGEKGLFVARAMVSFDPLTVGTHGYPLLFQSGETFNGERLIDHQHPHDLIDELSVGYTYELSKDADLFGYAAYPGEPALGPTAFMHRPSAMNNPDAPLGHHWQDATHISFGVGTLGFRYKNLKIDGSVFNGREPDEFRYSFDKPSFNSFSYRISLNPSSNWALQFSQGFIESPEFLEQDVDVTRTTASALYSRKIKEGNQYDASFVWGYNHKTDGHDEHSVLLEDNHTMGKNNLYSRYEFVQKSSEELRLDTLGDVAFNIHAFTVGYNRIIFGAQYFEGIGGFQGTIYFPPNGLHTIYGKTPLALEVYLQIRPKLHKMR